MFHAYSASSLIWLGVPLGLAAMVMLLGLVAENVAGYVFVAICLAAGVFSMCGSIHGIIQAFREHVACYVCCYPSIPFFI
ncbi:MAG: hypothetical protein VB858_22365 [Planctomycetaceae bacterium]